MTRTYVILSDVSFQTSVRVEPRTRKHRKYLRRLVKLVPGVVEHQREERRLVFVLVHSVGGDLAFAPVAALSLFRFCGFFSASHRACKRMMSWRCTTNKRFRQTYKHVRTDGLLGVCDEVSWVDRTIITRGVHVSHHVLDLGLRVLEMVIRVLIRLKVTFRRRRRPGLVNVSDPALRYLHPARAFTQTKRTRAHNLMSVAAKTSGYRYLSAHSPSTR